MAALRWRVVLAAPLLEAAHPFQPMGRPSIFSRIVQHQSTAPRLEDVFSAEELADMTPAEKQAVLMDFAESSTAEMAPPVTERPSSSASSVSRQGLAMSELSDDDQKRVRKLKKNLKRIGELRLKVTRAHIRARAHAHIRRSREVGG